MIAFEFTRLRWKGSGRPRGIQFTMQTTNFFYHDLEILTIWIAVQSFTIRGNRGTICSFLVSRCSQRNCVNKKSSSVAPTSLTKVRGGQKKKHYDYKTSQYARGRLKHCTSYSHIILHLSTRYSLPTLALTALASSCVTALSDCKGSSNCDSSMTPSATGSECGWPPARGDLCPCLRQPLVPDALRVAALAASVPYFRRLIRTAPEGNISIFGFLDYL